MFAGEQQTGASDLKDSEEKYSDSLATRGQTYRQERNPWDMLSPRPESLEREIGRFASLDVGDYYGRETSKNLLAFD